MVKIKNAFLSVLAIVSILGFSGYFAQYMLGYDITATIEGLIFVAIGIGLAIEGQVRALFVKNPFKNGLSSDETSHLLAITVGFLSIIGGVLTLFGVTFGNFDVIKGVIALFAIIIIAIEAWVVK